MPFTQMDAAKNAGREWAGESIAEAIRDTLASHGVLSPNRDERLEVYHRLGIREGAKLTRASKLKIALALDVDILIEGTFAHDAARGELRVTASTLDVRHFRTGNEFTAAGRWEELSVIQQHLGWQALQFLMPDAAPAGEEFRGKSMAVKNDALESYVKGLRAENQDQKYRHLLNATRLDDRFALARFELGKLQFERNNYRDAIGWLERIPSTDPRYHQALFLAGLARYQVADYTGAEHDFDRLERRLPLAEVLNNLGATLSRQGRFEDALTAFQKAAQADPNDAALHFNVGYAAWRLGRYPVAAAAFRLALARNGDDSEAALFLGLADKPHSDDLKDFQFHSRERLRQRLEESAYLQLKAVFERKKP